MQFTIVCNKKRKPNQNTTRVRIVIAGAGVVITGDRIIIIGARIIIIGARIIIAGTAYVFWGKCHKNRFILTLFLVFSGKIRNEEKKMRVHVISHDPLQLIPQKNQSRKDPSREVRAEKISSQYHTATILYESDPQFRSMIAIST
ncbi:hypothetical protein DY000_02033116 [Brassica cretica]|uniref:Uncharacterized protein n=1 Tax=Brassica cretica TaxID=69181 RepID=A0ABQ7DVV2_BRACR|nr:hypothetical protein DY000_02033116 [Brassica cretica]